MKLFLEHYGTALFVILIIGIMTIIATPIGSNIKTEITNRVETVRNLDPEDAMYVGKYNGKNVTNVIITSTGQAESTPTADLFTVVLEYEDGTTEDVTSAGLLTLGSVTSSGSYYIVETNVALNDGKTFKGKAEIEKLYPAIYVGYNSSTTTLIFSNTTEHPAYQACDNKYGDISEDVYTSAADRKWDDIAKSVLYVSVVNEIKPKNTDYWFYNVGYDGMTSLNLTNLDTSYTKSMNYMFANCGYTALTTLDLGDTFNTTRVSYMNYMFQNCGANVPTTIYMRAFKPNSTVMSTSTRFTRIFDGMNASDVLYVTSFTTRTWIINRSYPTRPGAWSGTNIIQT